MRTGNWGHGKPQAVPTVSSYTVVLHERQRLPYALEVQGGAVLPHQCHALQ